MSAGAVPVPVAPIAPIAPVAPAASAPAPAQGEVLERLMALRDELVQRSSQGRYIDAASREWHALPIRWRMVLLMVAGVGVDAADLDQLASRHWHEFPEPERAQVKAVIRDGRQHLRGVVALAAKV